MERNDIVKNIRVNCKDTLIEELEACKTYILNNDVTTAYISFDAFKSNDEEIHVKMTFNEDMNLRKLADALKARQKDIAHE